MNLKNIYSVKNKELSVDELKQHNLIISFSILTQLLLIGFTIVNFFSHKIYSSYNNLSALFVLILISLYYKKTTNFNAAFTAFLITIVTLVSIQHLSMEGILNSYISYFLYLTIT